MTAEGTSFASDKDSISEARLGDRMLLGPELMLGVTGSLTTANWIIKPTYLKLQIILLVVWYHDSNENIKKVVRLINKTTTLHTHHTFRYISLLSPHKCEVTLPNFTFYGGAKQTAANFSFSVWTCTWFLGIQLQDILPSIEKVS